MWSSVGNPSASATEWIAIDLKNRRTIDYVRVQPEYNGNYFPKDFKFQSSNDGSTWTDVPGATYTNYPTPGVNFSNTQYFQFLSPVTARYIRMYATKLTNAGGAYYFQVASFGPAKLNTAYLRKSFYSSTSQQALTAAAASSSAGAGYEAAKAIDGSAGSAWSSAGHTTEACVEWLYVDAGSTATIKQIKLTPGAAGCFPVDFVFQYSGDAVNWTDIPGQKYAGYGDPGSLVQSFAIRTPVSARYVRLSVTRTRMASNGTYYVQIAAMELDK